MIIDALQCGTFTPEVLRDLRDGGLGCVTVTCGFWEGTLESLDSLGRWRDLMHESADVALVATRAEDLIAAQESNRIAVVLGFQNSNLLEGRIRLVDLFADLGVRQIQLTYNNQNELGASCYEEHDSGLARFGREVVREMNRCGILIDLSHVGNRTSLEAIEHSMKPVAVSHANPHSLFPHVRNKTDDVLKALAENGGVIGLATYRNITGDYYCSTVEAWTEMVARTVDIVGIDHVGIGTDRSYGSGPQFLDWMRRGRWTRGVNYGAGSAQKPGNVDDPEWFLESRDFKKIGPALKARGFSQEEADKILSGNWMRVYREAFVRDATIPVAGR